MNAEMSEKKSSFRYVNMNPCPDITEKYLAQSTVNSVAIAMKTPWYDVYDLLIQKAHELCRMPEDKLCVKDLLTSSGFVLQPGKVKNLTVSAMCRMMDEQCHDGQTAVVKTPLYWYGGRMTAIVPGDDGSYEYQGTEDTGIYLIDEVWIRWTDGQDHSPLGRHKSGKRTGGGKGRTLPQDHPYFHYCMQNPASNYVGDCVVRAMASVLGITWHEVVDALAESGNYAYTAINNEDVFSVLLERRGFIRHEVFLQNGRMLNGKEFCREMAKRYHHGERIYAYVGNSHVAAVMPVVDAEGNGCYRIEDTWDCSGGKIGWYWVEYKKKKPEMERAEPVESGTAIIAGTEIIHPAYGKGIVTEVSGKGSGSVLYTHFQGIGIKQLSGKWVEKHCRYNIN